MAETAKRSPNLKKWLIRAAGSSMILGILFWILPTDEVLAGFARLPLAAFALVLLAFLFGHVMTAAKWWFLLGRTVAFPLALRAHLAGLAANLCLPGVAGGDAVRAALVHSAMQDGARLTAGAVADRLIDMLALACLAFAGFMMLNTDTIGVEVVIAMLLLLLVLVGGCVYVLPRLITWLWTIKPSLPARGFMLRVAEAFGLLGRSPWLLFTAFVASFCIQLFFIFLTIHLATAIGLDVGVAVWVFAWPLAKLLAVAPISLGGLGVREATLAALMAPFGVEAASVVTTGLIWQAVLFSAGAIGGLIWVFSSGRQNAPLSENGSSKL